MLESKHSESSSNSIDSSEEGAYRFKTKESVTLKLELILLGKITAYQKRYRLKDRTQAMVDLLETGLKIEQIKDTMKDPTVLAQLKDCYRRDRLVDWLEAITNEEYEIILQAVKNAQEIRRRLGRKTM